MTVSVVRLIDQDTINDLAIHSNVAYGTAMYKRGGVEITELKPTRVEGWAGGLSGTSAEGGVSRRRVTFTVKNGRLKWHCTGNPKNHQIFCKHCVALALAMMNQ